MQDPATELGDSFVRDFPEAVDRELENFLRTLDEETPANDTFDALGEGLFAGTAHAEEEVEGKLATEHGRGLERLLRQGFERREVDLRRTELGVVPRPSVELQHEERVPARPRETPLELLGGDVRGPPVSPEEFERLGRSEGRQLDPNRVRRPLELLNP